MNVAWKESNLHEDILDIMKKTILCENDTFQSYTNINYDSNLIDNWQVYRTIFRLVLTSLYRKMNLQLYELFTKHGAIRS
jgi:hypothetical protein